MGTVVGYPQNDAWNSYDPEDPDDPENPHGNCYAYAVDDSLIFFNSIEDNKKTKG